MKYEILLAPEAVEVTEGTVQVLAIVQKSAADAWLKEHGEA